MASLGSVSNQFCGINPLLHNHLQSTGGWDNFHVNHISDLTRFLQRALRPLGYMAQAEQALQIRRHDMPLRTPESDVTVYDPHEPGNTCYRILIIDPRLDWLQAQEQV